MMYLVSLIGCTTTKFIACVIVCMSKAILAVGVAGAILGITKLLQMLSSIKQKTSLLDSLLLSEIVTVEEVYQRVASTLDYTGFVSGILDTFQQEYIPSKVMPGMNLLYSKLVLSTYNLRNPSSVYKTTISQRMSSILKLIDLKTGRSIKVLQTLVTNFGNIFDRLKSRSKRKSAYLSQNFKMSLVQLALVFVAQLVFAMSRFKNLLVVFSSSFFSWFHEEIYEEHYLPPGKHAVIYGTFTAKKDGVYTYKPQFITSSKEALLDMMSREIAVSRRLCYVLGLGLIPLIGWCCYKLYHFLIELLHKRIAYKNRELKDIISLEVQSYGCPVCSRNIRNVVTKSCHHLSNCVDCLKDGDNKCTECSKTFSEFVELYVN